ncbi:MAG: hypothetical protein ACHQD9_04035 [Chitinophagales bacterium]
MFDIQNTNRLKSIFASFVLLIVVASASAQVISEQYVPDILKKKMTDMYPEAKGTYWKQPMPGFMDAYFSLNKRKCNATFQVSGAWVSTDFEIPAEEFPDSAKQYLTAHTDKVLKYYRSESKSKGLQFSADGKINGEVMQFIFNKDGSYLMKGPRD